MLLMTKAPLLIAIVFLAVSAVSGAENEKKSAEPAPSEPDAATFVEVEIDEPSDTPACTCENSSKTQIMPQSKPERKSNKIVQNAEIKLAAAPTPVTVVLLPEEDSEAGAPAEEVELKTKANKENEAITKAEDADDTKEEVTSSPKSKNSKSEKDKDKKSSKKRSKRDTKGKTSKRRQSTKSKDGEQKNKNRKNRK